MASVTINPSFSAKNNALAFTTRELNYFLESKVYDTFDYYQDRFGVYSWMRLTEDMKFIIHWLEAEPFVWQKHKSCRIDPMGNVHLVSDEIEPVKTTALTETCYDVLFNSCFKHYLSWDGQGPLELSAEGQELQGKVFRKILQSFVLGARLALECGQLYDYAKLVKEELTGLVGEDLAQMFSKTMGTVKGWIETQREKAKEPGFGHLNATSIMDASHFSGSKFIGDVYELADRTLEVAPAALEKAIMEGGVSQAMESDMIPFWHVSSYIYKQIATTYRKETRNRLTQNDRLTMERETFNGTTVNQYYLDGMPVIPLHSINEYDQHLKVNTHYFGLNVTGNIALGASFRNIPRMNGQEIGVRMQVSEDNKTLGLTSVRTDSLMATALSNTDFMCGRILTLAKSK